MPKFSRTSLQRLETCHPDLQRLFKEVVKNYDCTILEGHRGKDDQDHYFGTGRSKLQWPRSKHNTKPSLAVDVAPYPINWDHKEQFYHFAGYVQAIADQMDIDLRFGGDWDQDKDLYDQSFFDLVHFEVEPDNG